MTHRLLRLSASLLLAGCALLVAAVLWDNWGDLLWTTPPVRTTEVHADTLQKGQYLMRAGNCMACHTTRGGAPLAGGRAIETPFGTVYSSNLTPDADTGLGTWNAQDFWHALHHGRSRGGRLLAPAFPYEHTSLVTREDSDALFAWLQAQPPVHQATPAHTLSWPLGTQAALALWRTLFFTPQTFEPDPKQSAEWNRGAYLVQGLGHCAACHSPRNALGASGGVADLSGGLMPVVQWNTHANISGPMGEVVQHSLQHLSPQDVQAMAVYLQSRARQALAAPTPATPKAVAGNVAERGSRVYERHCATCHGEHGEGVPGIYPALTGNRTVLLDEPSNLVQTVLFGGYGPATAGRPRPFGMPPFLLELEDRDIAAVLTHLRMALQADGHKAGEVTPLQVNRVRAAIGN